MRPTKYTPEIQQFAERYITDYQQFGDEVPSIASLCLLLKVARSTLYKWGDDNQEFSDTLSFIKLMQERQLINQSLNGQFNATIAKLMLSNHGYSEKQELNHSATLTQPRRTLNDFYADIQKQEQTAVLEALKAKHEGD